MSQIKINIDGVICASDKIKKSRNSIQKSVQNLKTYGSRIPNNVLSRNNISQNFCDINNLLNEIDYKLSTVDAFSVNAAEKYKNTDNKMNSDKDKYVHLIAINQKAKIINEFLHLLPFTREWRNDLINGYWQEFKEYIGDGVKKYIDKITDGETVPDAIVGCYKWIKDDLFGDFDTVKTFIEDVYEEYTFDKPELIPEGFGEFFDTIDYCDILVDTAEALKDYSADGDKYKAYETVGFAIFEKTAKEINKYIDKKTNLKYLGVDKLSQSILLKTIVEMPQNFVESVREYANNGTGTAGSVFVDTTIGAFSEVVERTTSPYYKASTALTYPVVDKICETFGYDLSSEYEKITGEKGLAAVWKAQKELWVDTVYEGAKEKASKGVDAFYDGVSWGWNEWKSGISIIAEDSKNWFK